MHKLQSTEERCFAQRNLLDPIPEDGIDAGTVVSASSATESYYRIGCLRRRRVMYSPF